MDKETSEKPRFEVLYPKRNRRRQINPVIRYLIISLFGASLAAAVFYLLKEFGY